MKVYQVEIAGKPKLLVPVYDLASMLLWLAQQLPDDNVDVRITTIEV